MLSHQKASLPQPALVHVFPNVLSALKCPQHNCGSAQNDLGCHSSMCCHMKHSSASENTKHLEIPFVILPDHIKYLKVKTKLL